MMYNTNIFQSRYFSVKCLRNGELSAERKTARVWLEAVCG